jgi:Tfp pilus assembly ATPase PilU
MIRVHGDVRRINLPPLEHKDVHGMIYDIMNDGQRKPTKKCSNATSRSRFPAWRASASTPSTRSAAPRRAAHDSFENPHAGRAERAPRSSLSWP